MGECKAFNIVGRWIHFGEVVIREGIRLFCARNFAKMAVLTPPSYSLITFQLPSAGKTMTKRLNIVRNRKETVYLDFVLFLSFVF
jgi:hypothetical protein